MLLYPWVIGSDLFLKLLSYLLNGLLYLFDTPIKTSLQLDWLSTSILDLGFLFGDLRI